MTIGEYKDINLLEYTGIIEDVEVFDNIETHFTYEQELLDGDYVYKRHGDTINVEPFDENKEDYSLYDVVMHNGTLHYISNTQGVAAKQPNEYSNIDDAVNSNSWTARYLYLGSLQNGELHKSVQVGSYEYKYTLRQFDAGDWLFSSVKWGWSDEEYSREDYKNNYVLERGVMQNGTNYYNTSTSVYCDRCSPTWHQRLLIDSPVSEGDEITLDNGEIYKIMTLKETKEYSFEGDNYKDRYFSYKLYSGIQYQSTGVQVLNEANLSTVEQKAVIDSNDPYLWLAKTIVLVGTDVYVRTNVSTPQETKTIPHPEVTQLNKIDDIDWGWTQIRPAKWLAPFDYKKYTKLETNSTITFTVKTQDRVDIIAFNNIKASLLQVDIYDNNNQIVNTTTKTPKCIYTNRGKDFIVNTRDVLYIPQTANAKIKITIHPIDGKTEVGGIYLADSIYLGRTQPHFKVGLLDLTPRERNEIDQSWERGKDVIVRTVSGDVNLELEDFDEFIPIVENLIKKKIIVDLSNNYENKNWDSEKYFASGFMIGRLDSFEQETVGAPNNMSGTYSFKIIEDV
jgi:hypothetical protein